MILTKPQISVVLPISQTNQYLKPRLESILSQNGPELELLYIALDATTTDQTKQLLRSYALQDERLVVLALATNSLADAWNLGLQHASGKYLLFMALGDSLEPDGLALAYKQMQTAPADILYFGYNQIRHQPLYQSKKQPDQHTLELLTYYANRRIELTDLQQLLNPVWNKIFRTAFLKAQQILFPAHGNAEITSSIFNLACLVAGATYGALPQTIYNHNTADAETMLTADPRQLIQSDLQAIMAFITTAHFQQATPEYQILLLNQLYQIVNAHYHRPMGRLIHLSCSFQIARFLPQLASLVDRNLLNYTQFTVLAQRLRLSWLGKSGLKWLFSIKNLAPADQPYKIKQLTLLGCRLQWRFNLDQPQLQCYLRHSIPPHTILIVEANNCHGETLGGLIRYFTLLGYNVDVMITPESAREHPLCRIKQQLQFNLFIIHITNLKELLADSKINQYEYLCFNSYHLYYQPRTRHSATSVFDFFPRIVPPQRAILAIEHHLEHLDHSLCQAHRILQLAPLKPEAVLCNTAYYGTIRPHPKTPPTLPTEFIIIGNIESFRKDYNLLFNSLQQLIQAGHTNFHITIVGQGQLYLPPSVATWITLTGRLPYNRMFDLLDQADFLLTLLDHNNQEHRRYLTSNTSGSFLLSYGFAKPLIIQKDFASVHYFNMENAVLYTDANDLATQMATCIQMPDHKYQQLVQNLSILHQKLETQSLNNLAQILQQTGGAVAMSTNYSPANNR